MIQLLGIVGRKQRGKDTLHSMLCQLSPVPVERFAFGDALKAEIAEKTGVPVHVINQLKDKFRPVLQWWGTDFRRDMCDVDYWLPWLDRALKGRGENALLCVTDVRFLNEADRIRECGGILVRIVREMPDGDRHTSESESDRIVVDATIRNDGNLDELLKKAEGLLLFLRLGAKRR